MKTYTINNKDYYSVHEIVKATKKSDYHVKKDLADNIVKVGRKTLLEHGYDDKVGGRTGVLMMVGVNIGSEYVDIMNNEKDLEER